LFEDEHSWQQACRGEDATPGTEDEPCPQPQRPQLVGAEKQLAAATSLCERADAEYRAGRDVVAIRMYTRALASLPRHWEEEAPGSGPAEAAGPAVAEWWELGVRLLSSRSAALMRQDDCAGALVDAERALSHSAACLPSASSAAASVPLAALLAECRYRRVLALLLLQRPAEALLAADGAAAASSAPALLTAVSASAARIPSSKNAAPQAAAATCGSEAVDSCERRQGAIDARAASVDEAMAELRRDAECMLEEQRYGRYDLVAMAAEAAAAVGGRVASLSRRRHAEFESADIHLEELGASRGRTLVACCPIPSGTLVIASRAFAFHVGRVQAPEPSRDVDNDDSDTSALLPLVVRRLVRHPELGAQLYSLSGGAGYEAGSGDTTRVDVLRIAHILVNK
jgi:hypothetical protein